MQEIRIDMETAWRRLLTMAAVCWQAGRARQRAGDNRDAGGNGDGHDRRGA